MEEQRKEAALGEALGLWASGLDHTDEVVWAILRFEDVLLGDRLPEVFLRLNLLRRQLAPRISVQQVLALDRLLDHAVWKATDAELPAFREAYQGARKWYRRDPIPAIWSIPTVSRNAIPAAARAQALDATGSAERVDR